MDFLLLFFEPPERFHDDSRRPAMSEMGKFAGELAAQGKMKGGAPLHPSEEGARVRVEGGDALVTDGPFAETKEILGGYFMVDCESLEEAVEIAKRCPIARWGTVEVRRVMDVGGGPDAG